MRIIAGEKRGAKLKTLEGEDTRPTLERVKEGVFSSIQFVLPGAQVLDLFAGSGQMGLEALSRGAAHCTFVDLNPQAGNIVLENAKTTGLAGNSRLMRIDANAFLATTRQRYDIIFLDPPYRQGTIAAILPAVAQVCNPGAIVLCETEPGLQLPQEIAGLRLHKQYRYGTVMVTRYQAQAAD